MKGLFCCPGVIAEKDRFATIKIVTGTLPCEYFFLLNNPYQMKYNQSMIKEFFRHPAIRLALTGGICIVVQAFFYKRIHHVEMSGIIFLLPGLIFGVYGTLTTTDGKKKKETSKKGINPKYLRPLYWHSAIILTTIISIIVPFFY